MQDGLVDGNLTISNNSEKPTFLPTLPHSAGRMQQQPSNPLVLHPPTTHTPFTASLPKTMVAVGVFETKLEDNGSGGGNTLQNDGHFELGTRPH